MRTNVFGQHWPWELRALDPKRLLAHADWVDGRGGERLRWVDADAAEATLDTLDLARVQIVGGIFDRANFSRTRFRAAELSQLRAQEARFTGATFVDASLTGCAFARAELGDVAFDGARLLDCDFRGADFANALTGWTGARFIRCDFRGVRGLDPSLLFARFSDCCFDDPHLHAKLIIGQAVDERIPFDETIDRLVHIGLSREQALELMLAG